MVFFDVSLGQIALVFVVGAATLGPRDLPRAARSFGYLMGRASRYLRDSATTANQLMREAEIPELKQDIQQSMKDMERIRSQIQAATRIKVDPFSAVNAMPSTSMGSGEGEHHRLGGDAFATEASARAGGGSSSSGGGSDVGGSLNPLEREMEEQLKRYDATQPTLPKGKGGRTLTEHQPSGADVIVECLRQQRFNRDCRNLIKEQAQVQANQGMPDSSGPPP
ncbi:hypothetical protein HOP50_13g70370 [Chloropicon primus]|uniref:Sec-independent protein translocase protein TatB n=1 Tax=Chloropicon primus TaxID=1764295 RepID=A0A5B8MUM0_9CHLO|nr:hypothetical protein A3770_13p70160 [Chloropicon primus]UPR03707.1 hypothetical protein HOP50_13g70370 [Chloropicon primus]|eukprot:QDZ24498.1 hypothetical protein A3770_13p70160 [Chloropicon primus]